MEMDNIFATLLLILISSRGIYLHDGICSRSAFKHEGKCTACPDRCATCVSQQNCTNCNSNYYGPVCEYTCQQDCEELCHKERGYCTEGCADGRFPEPNSPRCPKCPAQCKTCKSLTECFECIPGYYGKSCENRCVSYCEKCNKTAGSCLVCDEGYFNQDGQCRRCPDGCVGCSDEKNCSSCQSGYFTLHDNQCIMECPITSNTSDKDATTYSTGDMMAHGCTDTARGQRFVIKTRKPCIQYSICSPNIMCPPEYEGKSACGTIKTYQCSHSCRHLNESCCRCEPNCTIIEEGLFSMAFCFTNEQAFSDIKLSSDSECSSASEDLPIATRAPQPTTVFVVVMIIETLVILVCVPLLLFLLVKRYRTHRTSQWNDAAEATAQEVPEESNADLNHPPQAVQERDDTSSLNGRNSSNSTNRNMQTEWNQMLPSAIFMQTRHTPYYLGSPYSGRSHTTRLHPFRNNLDTDEASRLTPYSAPDITTPPNTEQTSNDQHTCHIL